MAQKLMIVKVVFEYFVQYFKAGEKESYHSYTENYAKTKAFDRDTNYPKILRKCHDEIQSEFDIKSNDTNEDTGEEFQVDITYDIQKLISYEILAEED